VSKAKAEGSPLKEAVVEAAEAGVPVSELAAVGAAMRLAKHTCPV